MNIERIVGLVFSISALLILLFVVLTITCFDLGGAGVHGESEQWAHTHCGEGGLLVVCFSRSMKQKNSWIGR